MVNDVAPDVPAVTAQQNPFWNNPICAMSKPGQFHSNDEHQLRDISQRYSSRIFASRAHVLRAYEFQIFQTSVQRPQEKQPTPNSAALHCKKQSNYLQKLDQSPHPIFSGQYPNVKT